MKDENLKKSTTIQKLDKALNISENGDIVRALKMIKKLYKRHPKSNIIKLRFAETLIATNQNRDKAIKYFHQLLGTNVHSLAMFNLGEVEFYNYNLEESEKYFSSILMRKVSNFSKLYLGRINGLKGNYIEAKNMLESILDSENDKYLDESDIKQKAIYELLSLNTSYEKYMDALFWLEQLFNLDDKTKELSQYEFYLKYKLGLLDTNFNYEYFYRQVVCYSSDEAIKHIKMRHVEVCDDDSISAFLHNISIEELFILVQNNIEYLQKIGYGKCDKYLLNLGFTIGRSNNIKTSVVKIVTICNTYDVITMYPTIDYCNEFPKEKVKIK